MVVDERLTDGANTLGYTSKCKGKAVEPNKVRAPKALRPVCAPTTFYRPDNTHQIRVLYQQHFQNIAQEEP